MKVSLRWLADYIELPTQDPGELKRVLDCDRPQGRERRRARVRLDRGLRRAGRRDQAASERRQGSPLHRHHRAGIRSRSCAVPGTSKSGAKVAFAVPGAVLPGGMEIGRREIRGIESAGMILSERELGLGDDHAGILVLDPDAPVGVDFTELVALPDVIFDLEITSNRPDAMSMIGIARELAAYYDIPYTLPPIDPPTSGGGHQSQGSDRGSHRLLSVRRPRTARCQDRTLPVLDAPASASGRGPPDLERRRREQLRDARAGPAASCLRSRQGDRRVDHRSASEGRGRSSSPSTGWSGLWSPTTWWWRTPSRPRVWPAPWEGRNPRFQRRRARVLIEAAAWDPPTIMYMSRRHGLRSEASRTFRARGRPQPAARRRRPGCPADDRTDRWDHAGRLHR